LNPRELKALSEGTSSAGGILVPTPVAGFLIDRARNKSRVIQAGATTIAMDYQTLKVPRLTGSSAPAWRLENAAVAVGDLTLDSVTLTAQSMAFLVKISRELVEDAGLDVVHVVEDDLAKQVALELDRVALRGSGTPPEPRGVKNTTGVTLTAFGGANGAAPTNYDYLIDGVQAIRANNFEPDGVITSPRSETSLAKLKDTTGQTLRQPSQLDGLPRLTTNQIPTNITTGTSTDTAEVYVGQWPLLYIGLRTGPLMLQLVERYADFGQIAMLVWMRADIAVAQPGAFAVVGGVRP
jgi:HK97 family phage major capsid protein